MSWIHTIEPQDADPTLRQLYARVADPTNGQLDNIMRVHSLHADGLSAHFSLYSAVMAGTATLRKVERELIALIVSRKNSCEY